MGPKRLGAVLAAMLIMASPLAAQKKIERRMPLGMEGAFRIMNMVGSVVIHGWNKDTVLIRGTLAPGDQFFAGGGYTGANLERPGVRQLLADIEAGKIDCVVVYKVDRLSRSLILNSEIKR